MWGKLYYNSYNELLHYTHYIILWVLLYNGYTLVLFQLLRSLVVQYNLPKHLVLSCSYLFFLLFSTQVQPIIFFTLFLFYPLIVSCPYSSFLFSFNSFLHSFQNACIIWNVSFSFFYLTLDYQTVSNICFFLYLIFFSMFIILRNLIS